MVPAGQIWESKLAIIYLVHNMRTSHVALLVCLDTPIWMMVLQRGC